MTFTASSDSVCYDTGTMKAWKILRVVGLAVGVVVIGALLSGCFTGALPGDPVAIFSVEPEQGTSPLEVGFDATSSTSPGASILAYSWEFGNGATGTGATVLHTFHSAAERVFTVTLTITDDQGRQATASAAILVRSAEVPVVDVHVEFTWPFHYNAEGDDAANLNDEYFVLQNDGDHHVDLGGWTVENERGFRYRIPHGFTLPADGVVYIHSGAGVDTAQILYWNAPGPVWNNASDIAILRDETGTIVTYYAYFSC